MHIDNNGELMLEVSLAVTYVSKQTGEEKVMGTHCLIEKQSQLIRLFEYSIKSLDYDSQTWIPFRWELNTPRSELEKLPL